MTESRRRPDTTRPGSRAGPQGPPLEALDFESAQALPERHLGRFVVTEELGRGGMGVVYRGIDPALQRPVAIKLLWGGRSGRRFATEAHTAARIRHPHVIPVHEIGVREDDGAAYLVMDFVAGETLAERIEREGPLTAAEAAQLTLQIAGALAAAHREGVLHRDVKPSNVLLSDKGAQLTDFGLAKDLAAGPSGLSTDGTFLGTPGFAPPEQATGALAKIGPPSDVYGLGATFYYALTGDPPVEVTSLQETVIATCARDPRPPGELCAGLDPALEAICLACLAKDPGERPADAAQLERLLADALGAPPPRAPRGRGALAGVVALAAVLGVGGLIAWLTRPVESPAAASPPPTILDAPTAAPVLAAAAALEGGDALAALDALELEREIDGVDATRLRLAERAVELAAQDPRLGAHLDARPAGTTRDHLRCLAALRSGQLEPLLGELRRAPDTYRRRLNAALELEQRCRELEALMAPIEDGPALSNGELGVELEQLGMLLFAEAQRLFAIDGLPAAMTAALRPRCDLVLALLLANYGEAIGPCPTLYDAAQAYRPRCAPEVADAYTVGLHTLGMQQGDASFAAALPEVDPLSLHPLLGLLLYNQTRGRRTSVDAATIEEAEGILTLMQTHPGLVRRFTKSWIDQRLFLIGLYRLRALGDLDQPPDPGGPDLQRALALGLEAMELAHDEDIRAEHALTLLCCGRDDAEIEPLLAFIRNAEDHTYQRELLWAELELRRGDARAALDRLDALRERPRYLPVDTHVARAHALALLGEPAASARARKSAPKQVPPWIPWRKPQRLADLLAGQVWWPGAE